MTTPAGPPEDLYSTPGHHYVNGRHWFTSCERYSQTIRCRTDIWATQVTYSNRHFRPKTGWYFNNLTYLPRMSRVQWAHNLLGHTGDGSQRVPQLHPGSLRRPEGGLQGNRTYYWTHGWMFNNIVRFR